MKAEQRDLTIRRLISLGAPKATGLQGPVGFQHVVPRILCSSSFLQVGFRCCLITATM